MFIFIHLIRDRFTHLGKEVAQLVSQHRFTRDPASVSVMSLTVQIFTDLFSFGSYRPGSRQNNIRIKVLALILNFLKIQRHCTVRKNILL